MPSNVRWNFVSAAWAAQRTAGVRIHFFCEQQIPGIPTIITHGCDVSVLSPTGLPCKTAYLFEKLYEMYPRAKWYARMMDDTAVFLSNLLPYLQTLNHTDVVCVGKRQVIHWDNDWQRYEDYRGDDRDIAFPQGGCGWIVSNGLLRQELKDGILQEFRDISTVQLADDLGWGHYMQSRSILITTNRGFYHQHAVMTSVKCPLLQFSLCNTTATDPYHFQNRTSWPTPLAWHCSHGTFLFMPQLFQLIMSTRYIQRFIPNAEHNDNSYFVLCPCM